MTRPTAILAIDTAAAHCAVALLVDTVITTRVDKMAKGQAEHLMPMLEQFLSENDLSWGDLCAIGVGVGPGNFTGIRISVSAARGLALGLGVPSVGVSGFETLAQHLGRKDPYYALISAPRERAYACLMNTSGSKPLLLDTDETQALDMPQSWLHEISAHQMIASIAKQAQRRYATPEPRPAPLYIRAADAAPPRNPAPTILT